MNGVPVNVRADLSDRLVAYRIHGIDDLLGHRVLPRSSELAAAIRVDRVLNAVAPVRFAR